MLRFFFSIFFLAICLLIAISISTSLITSDIVNLWTIEYNGGHVHLVRDITKKRLVITDVMVTSYCVKLQKSVQVSSLTGERYYHVDCDGVVGFVSLGNVK